MEICYYESLKRNFGDDLNPYIIKNFIPNYKESNSETILYFIGTILFDDFIGKRKISNFENKKKIVLGSGVRFINNPPSINPSWDIRFLRGPLSALALKQNPKNFITDPAYLVREMPFFSRLVKTKKHKISLMPHFLSVEKFDWANICKKFNINYINPSEKKIEKVLQEVNDTEFLITEAMHGAIIADALRVPWKRFKCFSYLHESEMVSEFKWSDWLFSMNLDHSFYDLNYNKLVKQFDKKIDIPFLTSFRTKNIDKQIENLLESENYQLSKDSLLKDKVSALLEQIVLLKKQQSN